VRRHEKALRRCRRRFSEKSVHDLRIATRRLIAQLELLNPFIPGRTFRKVRRRLKRQLNASALLRDAQVQVLQVRGLLPEHPELAPVYRHLEMNELSLRRLAKGKLKGGGKLLRRLQAVEKTIAAGLRARNGIPRYRATMNLALRSASVRLADFRRSPPRDSEGIHRLRIALRKLRYLAESLPAGLSVLKPAEIRLIRSHLDLMGEIHDLDLLIERLRGVTTKGKRVMSGFGPIRKSLRSKYVAQVRSWRGRTTELSASLDAISRADPLLPEDAGLGRPSLSKPWPPGLQRPKSLLPPRPCEGNRAEPSRRRTAKTKPGRRGKAPRIPADAVSHKG
jgi:CHAD domain-containing protein